MDPVRGARLVLPWQDEPETRGRSRSPRTTPGPSTRCRSSARAPTRPPTATGPPTFVTDDTHWWDGSQIYGRDPAIRRRAPHRRVRKAADRRARPPPRASSSSTSTYRRRRQLLGRARAPAQPLHARAQRDLRPPARRASRALRRRPLRQGAAGRRGADGEDPHGRLDAGDHRPPDHRARRCDELVGPRGRAARQAVRPPHENEVLRGIPGSPTEPPRRALLADRGVRLRLPHAPTDPRRLQLPLARRRQHRCSS